jgi:hypothetical protein
MFCKILTKPIQGALYYKAVNYPLLHKVETFACIYEPGLGCFGQQVEDTSTQGLNQIQNGILVVTA